MRKGQAMSISTLFTVFFTIGVVVFLYFMFYGRYLDVQVMVESNEVERRTMDVAQVVMSSKDLTHSEDVGGTPRFYRGVFDEEKLDAQMMSSGSYVIGQPIVESALKEYLTYPGTVTEITVSSGGGAWFTAFADSSNADSSAFYTCIINNIGLNLAVQYESCQKNYMSGSNRFENVFPVLIRDSGGALHPGNMTVVMTSK